MPICTYVVLKKVARSVTCVVVSVRGVTRRLQRLRHFSVNFLGCLSSDVCSGVSTAEVVSVCVRVSVEVCV